MNPKPSSNRKKPTPTHSASTGAKSKPGIQETPQKDGSWLGFLFNPFNLLFLFVAILFLVWCNSNMPSYNWVQKDLLRSGYESCDMVQKEIDKRCQNISDPRQKRQIAQDTKYEFKVGLEFVVLKQIRDMTPPDAVILFPPYNVMTQKTSYLTLRYELTMKAYSSYFLYPRTIVYEQEEGKNPMFNKVNYVFALHGWGFQYLDYEPKQRNAVDILPVHQAKI